MSNLKTCFVTLLTKIFMSVYFEAIDLFFCLSLATSHLIHYIYNVLINFMMSKYFKNNQYN